MNEVIAIVAILVALGLCEWIATLCCEWRIAMLELDQPIFFAEREVNRAYRELLGDESFEDFVWPVLMKWGCYVR